MEGHWSLTLKQTWEEKLETDVEFGSNTCHGCPSHSIIEQQRCAPSLQIWGCSHRSHEGVSEATLTNVKGFLSYFHLTITILLTSSFTLIHFFFLTVPSPSALRLDTPSSFGAVREVIAIKDYCLQLTTLKFSKGDCLYVIDTSGGEWWYAHNSKEMGYIPAAYVQPDQLSRFHVQW